MRECTYPVTALRCVSRIYTDLAVIDVTPDGLAVVDIVEGLSHAELERLTGVKLAQRSQRGPRRMNAKLQTTLAGYRAYDRDTQPDYLYPPYASTVKRSPSQPLVPLQATLSEITGPVFGFDRIHANDADLTKQGNGEPIGERIVVSGRVLDEQRQAGAAHAGRDLAGEQLPAAIRIAATSTTRRSIRTSTAPAAR